ncbi:hypothetical protein TcasGA2_TC000345 [Tribolium castaneum]|uniref:Uncharacterized protein n=1 Tax=Tribolium castaneum TaxID=7070 RepID=D6WAT2_TRICA|nr:hypothetical protein TcasGA2_TC000345 [Tribolium castaneum]
MASILNIRNMIFMRNCDFASQSAEIFFDSISASGGKNAAKWNYNENFV